MTPVAATTAISPPRSHARTSLPPVWYADNSRIAPACSRQFATRLPLEHGEVRLDGDAPIRPHLLDDEWQLVRAVEADEHFLHGVVDALDDRPRRHLDELAWTDLDERHLADQRDHLVRRLGRRRGAGEQHLELAVRHDDLLRLAALQHDQRGRE